MGSKVYHINPLQRAFFVAAALVALIYLPFVVLATTRLTLSRDGVDLWQFATGMPTKWENIK